MRQCVPVSVDIFDLVEPLSCDVLDELLWHRCHIVELPVVAVDDRWHVGVVPQRRQRHANVDADGDNRSVGRPIVELAAGRVVAVPLVVAAGVPVDFVLDRYRLLVIFSKNHWLPKFCIVCLM